MTNLNDAYYFLFFTLRLIIMVFNAIFNITFQLYCSGHAFPQFLLPVLHMKDFQASDIFVK